VAASKGGGGNGGGLYAQQVSPKTSAMQDGGKARLLPSTDIQLVLAEASSRT